MEITIGILALKPRTSLVNGCLIIDSPRLIRLGLLCAYRRTVIIDPGNSRIDFRTFLFGTSRQQTVLFSEVARLDYGFDETGINTGSAWLGSHDSTEWFTLRIVLKENREELVIGRFIGEGSVDYGLESILAGDDVSDYRGDQQERSLGLVKLVQAMTGFPLT